MDDEQLGSFGGEDDGEPHAPEPSDDEPPARQLSADQRALNVVGIEQARIALTAGRAAISRRPQPQPSPAPGDVHRKVPAAARRACVRRSRG